MFGVRISVLILLLLIPSNSFAALDKFLEWEVRTTGNNNSGGCYEAIGDGGTDYSQQDAAQLSLTDLAMTASGTTLTSVTGGFTAAMVDNCIQITAGTNFVTGFYHITVRTDTNTVTIDRDATTGGNGSSGTGAVGGGLLTIQKAVDAVVGGNTIWVKDGTYAEEVTLTGPTKVDGDPLELLGYVTSHNDNPTGASRPDVTGSDSRTNVLKVEAKSWFIGNMRFHNATGAGVVSTTNGGVRVMFFNCRFDNNGNDGITIRNPAMFIGCEFDNNVDGWGAITYTKSFVFCYFHDNSADGLDYGGDGISIIGSVADTNADDGFKILTGGRVAFVNNVAYNNTNDGFTPITSDSNGDPAWMVINNISTDNGTGYRRLTNNYQPGFFGYNTYNGNTTNLSNFAVREFSNISTDPDFTDDAAGDFTLKSSSPAIDAGAALDTFTSATGDYKWNMGVDQDDVAAAGGGGAGGELYVF